jgi:hypothetical protein
MREKKFQFAEKEDTTTIKVYKTDANELSTMKYTHGLESLADVVRWVLKVFKDVVPIKK